jgi:hypothetical protein
LSDQLVIPDCGLELCPYDKFKSIVLANLNLECISEPLKSHLLGMSSDLSRFDVTLFAIFVSCLATFICFCVAIWKRSPIKIFRKLAETDEYMVLNVQSIDHESAMDIHDTEESY